MDSPERVSRVSIERNGASLESIATTTLANYSLSLLFTDTIGPRDSQGKPWTIVDFFGEAMREAFGGTNEATAMISRGAWDNARRGFDIAPNDKIRAKYQYLIDYMTPRLPLWGLKE